jgi:hypothetical protein
VKRERLSVVLRERASVLHCAYLILSLCIVPFPHLHGSSFLWLNRRRNPRFFGLLRGILNSRPRVKFPRVYLGHNFAAYLRYTLTTTPRRRLLRLVPRRFLVTLQRHLVELGFLLSLDTEPVPLLPVTTKASPLVALGQAPRRALSELGLPF